MYSYTNNPSAPPSGLDPSGFKTDPNSGLGPLTSWADQTYPLDGGLGGYASSNPPPPSGNPYSANGSNGTSAPSGGYAPNYASNSYYGAPSGQPQGGNGYYTNGGLYPDGGGYGAPPGGGGYPSPPVTTSVTTPSSQGTPPVSPSIQGQQSQPAMGGGGYYSHGVSPQQQQQCN